MIYVPEKFQPNHPFPYPPDNTCEFERWYYENYHYQEEEREYLPVFWTAYYCRHKFGQHRPAMVDLQKLLKGLDRSKKYYTIVQYDNGIIHDLSGLDIKVFSMSGGRTDYPLPLVAQAHEHNPAAYDRRSRHFYNFVGKVTHPIREKMIKGILPNWSNYVVTTGQSLQAYCKVLRNSTFTLCPRGFGPTSFRIQEALQYGSIPVYISDEFVIPHNIEFQTYGVIIPANQVAFTHDILTSVPPEEIARKQAAIPEIYQKYFTYEGCREMIRKHLNSVPLPV